jgi:hypothetical protein
VKLPTLLHPTQIRDIYLHSPNTPSRRGDALSVNYFCISLGYAARDWILFLSNRQVVMKITTMPLMGIFFKVKVFTRSYLGKV